MNRMRLLPAAGLATFLVSLVVLLPAASALRWIAPESVVIGGVAGTLWAGSAASIRLNSVLLADTSWDLSVPSLLLGQLAADVETRLGDGRASGAVRIGFGGKLGCSDCRYAGPVSSLKVVAPALGNLPGQAELDLTTLEIADGWPTRAVGEARLNGVSLAAPGTNPAPGAPRGDFSAVVNADPVPEDGLIEIAVQDEGGPVELNARLNLTRPGNFEFSGRVRARADAPPEVGNALSMLGRKEADGSTELGLSGTF